MLPFKAGMFIMVFAITFPSTTLKGYYHYYTFLSFLPPTSKLDH